MLAAVRCRVFESEKLRHRLQSPPDVAMHVDEFQDVLEGLIMVEAEFRTADLLAEFPDA